MFAHDQICFGQTHVSRTHDFKGFRIFQHAILVDTAFVRKCVFPNNRLVKLNREPRHSRNTTRDVHQLGGIYFCVIGHDITADLQCHDDFFQRCVACAFAQTVDRTLNLTRAPCNRGQGIGSGHAKVVVTVGCKDHAICTGHPFDQHTDQISAFDRRGIAHCVGDVDRCGTSLDRDFDNAAQVIMFGPCGIHGRPLDIVAQIARMGDRFVDAFGHLVHIQIRDRTVQG